jgi:hypothetical protein
VNRITVFVDGGGDMPKLQQECRDAFKAFFEKLGYEGRMPRVIACGSRNLAYKRYRSSKAEGDTVFLLVDSEGPIIPPLNDPGYDPSDSLTWRPWHHVQNRRNQAGDLVDIWPKPANASDEDLHFMVEQMENLFLADRDTLKSFYGKDFNENCLPKQVDIEHAPKDNVIDSLRKASANCQKGAYSKGGHSFGIMGMLDVGKVLVKSPWINRLHIIMDSVLQSDIQSSKAPRASKKRKD